MDESTEATEPLGQPAVDAATEPYCSKSLDTCDACVSLFTCTHCGTSHEFAGCTCIAEGPCCPDCGASYAPLSEERIPTTWDRKAILNEPTDYAKNQNRLSNLRWPLGQEPDGEGSVEGDGWVNVKLDVTEHENPGPNQRNLLHGGPELTLPCFRCGYPLHAAAEKTAKEILEEGGFSFKQDVDGLDEKLVACVCLNGHVTQLREDMVEQLIKRED